MRGRDLTGAGLIRALRGLTARPAVVSAVQARAEALAASIEDAGGVTAEVAPTNGGFAVTASGPGLFAREFGGLDTPARPVIAPAIEAAAAPLPGGERS